MKQKMMVTCLILIAISASSCATLKKSVLTGSSVGAGAGIVASTVITGGGALKGALVGALIGGVGGHLIHRFLQKRDSDTRQQTMLNLDKFSVSAPTARGRGAQNFQLSAPDVDKECFDWEVRGNQLVQQHCVWTIRGNATWSSSPRRSK